MSRLFINKEYSSDCVIDLYEPFKIDNIWKKINLLYFSCAALSTFQNANSLQSLQIYISLNTTSLNNNSSIDTQFIIPIEDINKCVKFYSNGHFYQNQLMKKNDINVLERLTIRIYRSDFIPIITNFDFEFLLEFSE